MGQVGGEICYFTLQLRTRLFFMPDGMRCRVTFYYSFACARRRPEKFTAIYLALVIDRRLDQR